MRNLERYLTPFIIGILIIVLPALVYLISVSESFSKKIDISNLICQILVASAALLAFGSYYVNKKDKIQKESIKLVTFFRENIIEQQNQIIKMIKNNASTKDLSSLRLENFDISNIEGSFSRNRSIFINQSIISEIDGIDSLQSNILNSVDEFALRVNSQDLANNNILILIIASFVEIIEHNIFSISRTRVVGTSANSYHDTLRLYDCWKDRVDRKSPEVRLKEMSGRILPK